jgi:hypothetical protein
VLLYCATRYELQSGKGSEYQDWIASTDNRKYWDEIEKETGVKYTNTYFTIFALGDSECETWWSMPDWASIGKLRSCRSFQEWIEKVHREFVNGEMGLKRRIMIAGRDTKLFG